VPRAAFEAACSILNRPELTGLYRCGGLVYIDVDDQFALVVVGRIAILELYRYESLRVVVALVLSVLRLPDRNQHGREFQDAIAALASCVTEP
jgi:hypothetical protein